MGDRGNGGNRGPGWPTGGASALTQGTSVPAPGGTSVLTQESFDSAPGAFAPNPEASTSTSPIKSIKPTGTYQEDTNKTIIGHDDEMDDSTLDTLHSTPKTQRQTEPKKTINKKTTPSKRPTPPQYSFRGWTLNREDKKMYNATGESRVMTSEEWRAFQLLDKQWRNKLEKQKQKQHQQQQRQERRLRPTAPTGSKPTAAPTATTTTSTIATTKRNLSDTSTDMSENKKTKTDDETEHMETDQVDWEAQSNKYMTIRIQSTKTNLKLTQDDIQHINRTMMRALYAAAEGDLDKWRRLQPDKMSLLHPNLAIRLRLTSEEGIDFWRNFVPTIPPRMEGGDRYLFLGPGETLTEKICFWVPDASFGEGKDVDLQLLTFAIRAGNPKFEKVDFTLQTMGIDQNTLQSVMIMELMTADRERCLGPKPKNPTDKTDWKLKIGLSNTNVKIAFARSDERRAEHAQARLNKKYDEKKTKDDEATEKDKPTEEEILDKQDDDEILELNKEEVDKMLEDDLMINLGSDTETDIPGVVKITDRRPEASK